MYTMVKIYKSALRSTSLSSSDLCSDETSCPLTSGVTKICVRIQNSLTHLAHFGSDIPTGCFSNHHRVAFCIPSHSRLYSRLLSLVL